MQTSSHEQPLLRDVSLIMLVHCPFLAPLWNTVADICSEHAEALNAVSNVRVKSQASFLEENSVNPSTPGHHVLISVVNESYIDKYQWHGFHSMRVPVVP